MKNITRIFALTLAVFFVFTAVSCGNKNTPDEEVTKDYRTVTDHRGNTVTVPTKIDRIAVCDIYPLPSVLAVFFDSADRIVGIPQQSMSAAKTGLLGELYPELLAADTGYINGTELNTESLMALEPDIAFYSADDTKMGEALAKTGIPAVAISASKWEYDAVETLENWIELLSEIFPQNDRADKVKKYSEDIEKLVSSRTAGLNENEKERLFFLFQYSDSALTTSGKHFFGQWWADAVNAVNVGGEMDTVNSTAVGMEQIYVWDPTRILITNYNTAQPDDIYNNTVGNYDWSPVDAVKNGKVTKMPLGMYRSYTCGVDTPVTLLWLAKTVYPDLFEDIDITEETKKYYFDVFGITLTGEQAEKIFAPSSEGAAFGK